MVSRELFPSIASGLAAVELVLKAQAEMIVRAWSLNGSSAEHVGRVVRHLFDKPGKMLRPALVLLSGGLVRPGEPEPAPALVGLAAVVELIHSASLVHDDIIDQEQVRRGEPSLNMRYGENTAVLVGDILYSRSFALLASLALPRWEQHLEIFRLFCETTQAMCLGEIGEQQMLGARLPVSLVEYLEVLSKKTAVLMSACCRGAGIVCGATGELTEALAGFGLAFGLAFQLLDDASDRDELAPPGLDLEDLAREHLRQARAFLTALPPGACREELQAACDLVLGACRP